MRVLFPSTPLSFVTRESLSLRAERLSGGLRLGDGSEKNSVDSFVRNWFSAEAGYARVSTEDWKANVALDATVGRKLYLAPRTF